MHAFKWSVPLLLANSCWAIDLREVQSFGINPTMKFATISKTLTAAGFVVTEAPAQGSEDRRVIFRRGGDLVRVYCLRKEWLVLYTSQGSYHGQNLRVGQDSHYLMPILGKSDSVHRGRSTAKWVYEDKAQMATFQVEGQAGKISRITINPANSVWAESWYERTFGR